MHSSACGTVARMVWRSCSSAPRWSALTAARYSSMVLGFAAMPGAPKGSPERIGAAWDSPRDSVDRLLPLCRRTCPRLFSVPILRFGRRGVEKRSDRRKQFVGVGPDHEV